MCVYVVVLSTHPCPVLKLTLSDAYAGAVVANVASELRDRIVGKIEQLVREQQFCHLYSTVSRMDGKKEGVP